MTAEVMKSFGTLQLELEQAKSSLKNVDEHIKKILGRDPSDNQHNQQTRNTGLKRPGPGAPTNTGDEVSRGRARNNTNNRNKQSFENDEHVTKKRTTESSVFKRLDRPRHFDDDPPLEPLVQGRNQHHLISKVIVTPKELPSRQDVLNAQGADEKSKARNRRMFGALLGTLQKFRQEETKLKPKEEKRAQVEKKLEEQQIREREELKKERQDLFLNRKKKQQEIRMIELKMTRLKELAEWEEKQRPLMSFIQTKAKHHIYYIPKILNEHTKLLLENNKQNIEKLIDRKRQDVYAELSDIEQKMKRNYNLKQETNDEVEEKTDEFVLEDEDVEMKEIPIEKDPPESINEDIVIVNKDKDKEEEVPEYPKTQSPEIVTNTLNTNNKVNDNDEEILKPKQEEQEDDEEEIMEKEKEKIKNEDGDVDGIETS